MSSTSGLIIRHGPHQGAQKSTRTGWLLLWTSRTKAGSSASGPAGFGASASGARPQAARIYTKPHVKRSERMNPSFGPEMGRELCHDLSNRLHIIDLESAA